MITTPLGVRVTVGIYNFELDFDLPEGYDTHDAEADTVEALDSLIGEGNPMGGIAIAYRMGTIEDSAVWFTLTGEITYVSTFDRLPRPAEVAEVIADAIPFATQCEVTIP